MAGCWFISDTAGINEITVGPRFVAIFGYSTPTVELKAYSDHGGVTSFKFTTSILCVPMDVFITLRLLPDSMSIHREKCASISWGEPAKSTLPFLIATT
jgi:hypothetical protein